MKNVVIAMYEKNAEEAAKVCRNHDIFAFIDEESLDDYIERLKRGIAEDSYILTDEEGGAPFLAALIVSVPGEGNGNLFQWSCLENPWTEEPGGLQSMGLQRIGYN